MRITRPSTCLTRIASRSFRGRDTIILGQKTPKPSFDLKSLIVVSQPQSYLRAAARGHGDLLTSELRLQAEAEGQAWGDSLPPLPPGHWPGPPSPGGRGRAVRRHPGAGGGVPSSALQDTAGIRLGQ